MIIVLNKYSTMKDIKFNFYEAILIILGVVFASIGLKGFLLPNGFLDGGAMGVSLLLNILSDIDISIWIIIVNIPFLLLGVKQFSVNFGIKSALAIILLSILVHYIDLPVFTDDKLLISVFGGFFLGSGIGFSIRGGAVIDGTEVIAVMINRKTSLTVGDFITIFNAVLFSLAAFLVGLEVAMYSMLTYITASKTVDFIINGFDEYLGVMIVSNKHQEIKDMLRNDLRKGVTIFKSDSGFDNNHLIPNEEKQKDRDVIFCVVTRFEVNKVIHNIDSIDHKAFVIQYPIKETRGGMIKRRPMH